MDLTEPEFTSLVHAVEQVMDNLGVKKPVTKGMLFENRALLSMLTR
jgi:hypothetical protein